MEWLQSPIVYRERTTVPENFRALLSEYFSPTSSQYHYLHMAEGNYREFLKGDSVWVKKYFYVLRPLLACRWIEMGLGVVPIKFQQLVHATVDDLQLQEAIAKLLEQKRAGAELDRGPRIPVLSDYIANEIDRYKNGGIPFIKPHISHEPLNALFRQALHQVW